MRRLLFTFIYILTAFPQVNNEHSSIYFEIDATDRKNDQFHVTVKPQGLTSKNNIFQFAATAPGVYQTHDIGRYVINFKAYGKNHREITTQKISTNQFLISQPENVQIINYTVNETWETKVDSNDVFKASGTSFEDDYLYLNLHCVLGYFKGMQSNPIELKLNYPQKWILGTSLEKKNGLFQAESFDHITDSPILAGKLTQTSTNINGTKIDVYAYSKKGTISAEKLLHSMNKTLESANKFVYGFPVKNYTFLFHLGEVQSGAWEHSKSSGFVLREYAYEEFETHMIPMVLHEFYHIVTPLNIHSEVIETFNYVKPVPSDHLWLYEGVVEWMTGMSLFKTGYYDIDSYFNVLKGKIFGDHYYGTDFSLIDVARNAFKDEWQIKYRNIYDRGALFAGLLDIELLSLSEGKRGLRDVLQELTKIYGPNRPFNEKTFIDDFTKLTYPEIGQFLKSYLIDADPLPYEEVYSKIGIKYYPVKTFPEVPDFGFTSFTGRNGVTVHIVQPDSKPFGLKLYDAIRSINGQDVNPENFEAIKSDILEGGIGTKYTMKVLRAGKELNINAQVVTKKVEYYFELNNKANQNQKNLRNIWLKQL